MADEQGGSQDGVRPSPERPAVNGAGSRRELDRLPPPAFPPGLRTRVRPRVEVRPNPAAGAEDGVPEDAFISPDEPIVRSGTRMAAGAFISPDEPIPPRPHDEAADDGDRDPDDGVVTGIGDDAHMEPEEIALSQGADPLVADLCRRIRNLADGLRDRGEAALRTTPEMARFDVTLRAYCVGYLVAQRESASGSDAGYSLRNADQ